MDIDTISKFIGFVGGILGIIAFGWRVWDARRSYLHIDLDIDKPQDGFAIIKAIVENRGQLAKRVDYAMLLVGPESENAMETFNALANKLQIEPISITNELEFRKVEKTFVDNDGHAVVPLPFFYSENVRVADERLTYSSPLRAEWFETAIPYAVRFFLFGEGRLHRSTQSVILFPERADNA